MNQKNPMLAVLTALLLGPLGMLYTSFAATLVFSVVDILLWRNGEDGWAAISWFVGVMCNYIMANEYNEKQLAFAQQARVRQ